LILHGKILSPFDYTLTLPDLPNPPNLKCPASEVHSKNKRPTDAGSDEEQRHDRAVHSMNEPFDRTLRISFMCIFDRVAGEESAVSFKGNVVEWIPCIGTVPYLNQSMSTSRLSKLKNQVSLQTAVNP
jgi:hypothetical protein